jgi:hypothetical protein
MGLFSTHSRKLVREIKIDQVFRLAHGEVALDSLSLYEDGMVLRFDADGSSVMPEHPTVFARFEALVGRGQVAEAENHRRMHDNEWDGLSKGIAPPYP